MDVSVEQADEINRNRYLEWVKDNPPIKFRKSRGKGTQSCKTRGINDEFTTGKKYKWSGYERKSRPKATKTKRRNSPILTEPFTLKPRPSRIMPSSCHEVNSSWTDLLQVPWISEDDNMLSASEKTLVFTSHPNMDVINKLTDEGKKEWKWQRSLSGEGAETEINTGLPNGMYYSRKHGGDGTGKLPEKQEKLDYYW